MDLLKGEAITSQLKLLDTAAAVRLTQLCTCHFNWIQCIQFDHNKNGLIVTRIRIDNQTDIKDVDYEPKGIFCQKCYLIKQVPAFSNDKEIQTHKRSNYEATRRRLEMYRHHCFQSIIWPNIKDPCCWLACCWCLTCFLPRCWPF